MRNLDFGDYVSIEQKRHSIENEMYVHKVINRLKSNTWVDVPVQGPPKEVWHPEMAVVVSCICCGVMETEVLKYRVLDIKHGLDFPATDRRFTAPKPL